MFGQTRRASSAVRGGESAEGGFVILDRLFGSGRANGIARKRHVILCGRGLRRGCAVCALWHGEGDTAVFGVLNTDFGSRCGSPHVMERGGTEGVHFFGVVESGLYFLVGLIGVSCEVMSVFRKRYICIY